MVLLFLMLVFVPCLLCEDSPNITFLSGEQTVVAGSPVNITCRVDSFPTSTITWYLDNELLNTTLVSQETLDNTTQESTVTISSVTTMDSGTYRCEAGNNVSTTNMNTTLTVESEWCGEDCIVLFTYLISYERK